MDDDIQKMITKRATFERDYEIGANKRDFNDASRWDDEGLDWDYDRK